MVLPSIAALFVIFFSVAAIYLTVFGYWIIKSRSGIAWFLSVVAWFILTVAVKLFFTSKIVEVTPGLEIREQLSIGFPVYKAIDGQEIPLRQANNDILYINSSNIDLIFGPIVYGDSFDDDLYPYDLRSHTHALFDQSMDYWPDEVPPEEMSIQSNSITVWWLTTEEEYNEY